MRTLRFREPLQTRAPKLQILAPRLFVDPPTPFRYSRALFEISPPWTVLRGVSVRKV